MFLPSPLKRPRKAVPIACCFPGKTPGHTDPNLIAFFKMSWIVLTFLQKQGYGTDSCE